MAAAKKEPQSAADSSPVDSVEQPNSSDEVIEKQYVVQWLLSHDGKDFKAGEKITLQDDEVEPLLKSGVITPYLRGEDVY